MHIMEGYLPIKHAIGWSAVSAPFLGYSLHRIARWTRENPSRKLFISACAGFVFVLSALKIPSVTGSCSHPTGIGLGAVLLGPFPMMVLGAIVLVFQALFLAHGGLTTFGANAFSMTIVGSLVASGLYHFSTRLRMRSELAIFLAASISNLSTYAVTSFQLGLAFPSANGGVVASTVKFLIIFMPTQVPLAISEGFMTAFVVNILRSHLGDDNRFPILKGVSE